MSLLLLFNQPTGGGGSFSVTVVEAASAADSLSALIGYASSLSETLSAIDTLSQVMSASVSLTEATAATDTVSQTFSATGVISESASATDSSSSGGDFAATDTEAAAAADTVSSAFSATGVASESATATDTQSNTHGVVGVVAETLSRTNLVPNSTMAGAVVGVIGSGGALPTGWSWSDYLGLIREVVAVGTLENGDAYVDLRLSGTNLSVSTVYPDIYFTPTNTIAASLGQTFTASIYLRGIAGTTSGMDGLLLKSSSRRLSLSERNSGGLYLTESATGQLSKQRGSVTRTMANASVAYVALFVSMAVFPLGSVDVTVRFSAPQLEYGSHATAHIPTSGTAVTVTTPSDTQSLSGIVEVFLVEEAQAGEVQLRSLQRYADLAELAAGVDTVSASMAAVASIAEAASASDSAAMNSLGWYAAIVEAALATDALSMVLNAVAGPALYIDFIDEENRALFVAYDGRGTTVSIDARALRVALDSRGLSISAEAREFLIAAEDRGYTVPVSINTIAPNP